MKISELLEKAENVRDMYGDLDVHLEVYVVDHGCYERLEADDVKTIKADERMRSRSKSRTDRILVIT